MGNCISSIAGRSNQVSAPIPEPKQGPEPKPIPHPDPDQSIIGHLIDGDASFLASNVSRNSWFSIATTNFSTWISQATEALAAMWGEDNEFLLGIDEGALPDGATAIDSQLRAFTFKELEAATLNFRRSMLLGREVLVVSTRVGSRKRCHLGVSENAALLSRDWIQAASKDFDSGRQ